MDCGNVWPMEERETGNINSEGIKQWIYRRRTKVCTSKERNIFRGMGGRQ